VQPNHSSGKSELTAFLTLLTALWSLLEPARTMDRTETGTLDAFLSVSLLFKVKTELGPIGLGELVIHKNCCNWSPS